MISLDLETHLIAPARLAPRLVYLAQTDGVHASVVDRRNSQARVRATLSNPIVGANIAFDLAVLAEEYPELLPAIFAAYDNGLVHDVQIRQKLIDIADGCRGGYYDHEAKRFVEYGYSLAALEARYFGRDRSAEKGEDAWRLRYHELDGIPIEEWPTEAREYPRRDVEGTLEVFRAQASRADALENEPSQCRAAFALHLMCAWGIKTDPVAIDRLEQSVAQDYRDLTERLLDAGLLKRQRPKVDKTRLAGRRAAELRDSGDPLLIALANRKRSTAETQALIDAGYLIERPHKRDTKAAKARMVDACKSAGVEPKLTEAEQISLDEEACLESGDELLIDYAERTSLNTIVTSHIPRLRRGVTTPIQSRFEVLLDTGRTSCRMGSDDDATNGYQLQNPKRDAFHEKHCASLDKERGEKCDCRFAGIRECFVPRPGFVFGDVDFDMLELRTVAQVCKFVVGYSKLGEALNAGRDVHLAMGATLLGIPYEEAVMRKKETEVKDARQLSKVINFGFPGGMGPAGFRAFASKAYRLKLTLDQCKILKRTWQDQWPEFHEYFSFISTLIGPDEVGTVKHFFSNRIRGQVPYTAACNSFFQGLGADGAKEALYEVVKRCYVQHPGSYLYGNRVVNFVHDQIIAEHPEDIAHEAVHEMRDVMVEACNRYLPDYPVTASPVLARRWSKEATATFENGRLVPWEWAV